MNLSHGGHLNHMVLLLTYLVHISMLIPHLLMQKTQQIDYDEFRKIVLEANPKLIIAGGSTYSRQIDFKKMAGCS